MGTVWISEFSHLFIHPDYVDELERYQLHSCRPFKGGGFRYNNLFFRNISRYQYMFLPVLTEMNHQLNVCVCVYMYTLKDVFHLVCAWTNVCLSMCTSCCFDVSKQDSWATVLRMFRVQEGYQSFQLHDETQRNWGCAHAQTCACACTSFLHTQRVSDVW